MKRLHHFHGANGPVLAGETGAILIEIIVAPAARGAQ
jgi:hypothetical protein